MSQLVFLMFLYQYRSVADVNEYQAIVGTIQTISDSLESNVDFKADLTKTSLFSPYLNHVISECQRIPSGIKYLPPDSFTYVSDAHGL